MNAVDRPPPVPGLLSIVIPLCNEVESLSPLKAEIDAALTRSPEWKHEVIFVDDGSTDDSWTMIRTLATQDSRVRGIRFRRNFGKAAALEAGFQSTAGEIVITMDADLQDDPKELPKFLEQIRSGFDLVSGYKKKRNDPWHKVFPSRVFNGIVSGLTGVKLHDHNCGYKAYRAAVVRDLHLYGELHRFVPVLAASRGFRVGETVVQHRARKFGRSKFGWRRFIKGFLDLLHVHATTTFGDRPMHFFGSTALIAWLLAGGGLILWFLAMLLYWFSSMGVIYPLSILATALALLLFGSQSLLIGYLAELGVTKRAEETFRIAERTEAGSDADGLA